MQTTLWQRYEQLYRAEQALAAQVEAERQAREAAQEAARQRAEEEAQRRLLGRYLPPAVLDGYRLVFEGWWQLVPTFAPLAARLDYQEDQRLGTLTVRAAGRSTVLASDLPAEEIERLLATVVVPAVEALRLERERQERWQQASKRVEELAEQVRAELRRELDDLARRYGWPEGRTLETYRLEWVEIGGEDGREPSIDRRAVWSLDPPEPGRWLRLILPDQMTTGQVLATVGAVLVTTERWQRIDDVPSVLTREVRRAREVQVLVEPGRGPSRHVEEAARLLAPGLLYTLMRGPGSVAEWEALPPLVMTLEGEVVGEPKSSGEAEALPV